jgi:exopolysaccharide biosynthesis polyprenyl glycosylphosphotransferase
MLRQHSRSVQAGLRVLDLLCLAVALPAAWTLRDALRAEALIGASPQFAPLLALTLLSWIAAAAGFRVYTGYRTQPLTAELGRITRALLAAAVLTMAGGYLAWRLDVSRLLLVLQFAFALALLVASRLLVRGLAHSLRRRGYNARRFAVVGSGELAEEVARTLALHPEWGCTLTGAILEHRDAAPGSLPVLGHLDEIGAVLERNVLDQVIFALPSAQLPLAEEAARACQEQGVAVMICLDLLHGGIGQMALTRMEGVPAITFSTVPNDAFALAVKRAFDVAVSAAVLLLLSPLLVGVAIAIKLDSPGPVLFRQRRVGLNGREFSFLKFRSMCLDAEARLAALRARNEMSGPVFKMTDDPRVTRVGRFIRRLSLDEFPQFWNVLTGEMSVVGPRPPIPSEVRQYQRWQRRRLSVKPGITCTWQVSGRNNIDFDRWMELDLEYIDNWSLARDLRICMMTIPAVLSSRGAR